MLWIQPFTGINPDHNQLLQFSCYGLALSLSGGILRTSEAIPCGQMQPQRSQDRMRVEVRFRTHCFQLLSCSWLKFKITVFGLDSLSFRNRRIRAVYIYHLCSHSRSPNASCSPRAAELGEAECPPSSLEKETTPRWVINRAGGGLIKCYGSFLFSLVSRTEICCFHKDLPPRALMIHQEPPSYARDFFCGRTRVEGTGKCCISWGCAKLAGFQCCCYFNYSNKQET